jgi:hypothetical protein
VVSCLYSGFGKRFSQELPWASHSGIERSTGPISNFLPIHKEARCQRSRLPAPGETPLCISNCFLFFRQLFHFQCVEGALACASLRRWYYRTHAKVCSTSGLCPQNQTPRPHELNTCLRGQMLTWLDSKWTHAARRIARKALHPFSLVTDSLWIGMFDHPFPSLLKLPRSTLRF